ncbi:MAG TPA: M1 family aminopeptidase, partial [Vicinamibacterales bacterium]|nr:M1 family aminopeptidase [Vicinamibacterales bacterium]
MGGAGVPEPGVSRSLARSRSSRISKLGYNLALGIPADPAATIDGRVEIAFDLKNADEPLAIDFRDAGTLLRTVTLPTAPTGRIDVEVVNGHIVVPPAALRDGTNVIVITFAAGPSIQRRDDLVYSLFVPAKAHHAFPCFDQPDLKADFSISVTAPADWTVLSNGHENSVKVNGDRCEFVFRSTRPISTYLVAIVAGRLVVDTAERNGRTLRMFRPVVDEALLDRNRDAIFDLHANALAWLEQYTAIDYPFDKFDFVLIPAFQFGGMEHPGAVYYNASSLLLDATPTEQQLHARAHLIAHETAHMWFGNYTTMPWFDDVWMKEVFANLMAAKIVEPMFPTVDHDLRFLLTHYPAAFAVDRTAGTHPVRQELDNLDDAGWLYGPIVYQKAPILMRDIECRMGEEWLRDALENYLETHAYGCAAWPELERIMTSRGLTYLGDRHPFESAGLPILTSDEAFPLTRPNPAFLPYGRIRFDERSRADLL